jgi:hypothetical protein
MLEQLALEIAVLCFFGFLYYFYQKRKILTHFRRDKHFWDALYYRANLLSEEDKLQVSPRYSDLDSFISALEVTMIQQQKLPESDWHEQWVHKKIPEVLIELLLYGEEKLHHTQGS